MSSDDDSSDCSLHDPNDSGPETVRNQYGSCPVHAAARSASLTPTLQGKDSTRGQDKQDKEKDTRKVVMDTTRARTEPMRREKP